MDFREASTAGDMVDTDVSYVSPPVARRITLRIVEIPADATLPVVAIADEVVSTAD